MENGNVIKIIDSNEKHLIKLAARCGVFYRILRGLFILSIIVFSVLFLLSVFSLFSENNVEQYEPITSLVSIVILGALLSAIFYILSVILKDISRRESPFIKKQVKRLRFISLLLIVFTTIDFIVSLISPILLDAHVSSLHYSVHTNESTEMINILAIIFAITMYCISVVFEYGAKLQEQSDEIL